MDACGVWVALTAVLTLARVLVESDVSEETPEVAMRRDKGTTTPGFTNRNGQVVVRRTRWPGNDFNQRVYVLSCTPCGNAYGANGSDIHLRRCPRCQGGAPGLAFPPVE
jgi:hypothetical protein